MEAAIPEPLARRARAVERVLRAVIVADLVAMAVSLFDIRELWLLPSGTPIEAREPSAAQLADAFAELAQLAAYGVCIVLFIRWFLAAHRNLRVFGGGPLRFDSRWAVWGWFVPVLNLFRPQQVMREIWTVSSRKWKQAGVLLAGQTVPADRIAMWWGLFLAMSFIGNAAARAELRASSSEELLGATIATLIADAVDIVAAVAAIAVVANVTALQAPLLELETGVGTRPEPIA